MGNQAIMEDRFWAKRMKRCAEYDHKFHLFQFEEDSKYVLKCVRCGFERTVTNIPVTNEMPKERVV